MGDWKTEYTEEEKERRLFAAMAMAGMSGQYGDPEFIAEQSVKIADALIVELNKEQ